MIDLDAPVNTRKFLMLAATVVIVFAFLIGAVFATGSTFGQRCAETHTDGSEAWTACVKSLAGGGSTR